MAQVMFWKVFEQEAEENPMVVSRSAEQFSTAGTGLSADTSLKLLLERGLIWIEEGGYSEGIALLTLARELISPARRDLIDLLDTFLRHYAAYGRAQAELQEAGKRFAETDEELHAQAAFLKTELPPLIAALDGPPLPSPVTARVLAHLVPIADIPSPMPGLSVAPALQPLKGEHAAVAAPTLSVTCFGRFSIRYGGQTMTLCPNRSGQTILRYLVAQPGHRASADMLMEMLWPDDEPEVARHKLQVAVSALRRSLINSSRGELNGYIQCKDRVYQLNPDVSLSSDVDEFLLLYHTGRQARGAEMAVQYEQACQLYSGPFLVEDIYADWSSRQRDYLCRVYLAMCGMLAEHFLDSSQFEDAVKWAGAILQENRTDEAAHRQLMRSYAAEGRRSEAVRQYQRCERILREDLSVAPAPETAALLQSILNASCRSQE
jgi:DNA-binding SARP family transcriptional activator